MGCLVCNLTWGKSPVETEEWKEELANDIVVDHPEILAKIAVIRARVRKEES